MNSILCGDALSRCKGAGSELTDQHSEQTNDVLMSFLINRLASLGRIMGSTSSSIASSSNPTMSTQVRQLVDSTVDENFVAIFSKSYCPYCKRAKTLINSLELPEGKGVKVYECVIFPIFVNRVDQCANDPALPCSDWTNEVSIHLSK